jgi:TPR repeat protein
MNRFIAFLGTAVAALAISSFASAQDTSGCYSAYLKDDYVTAFRECQAPAKQGDAFSQFTLGFMYNTGQGVALSYSKAAKWYRKAANQGVGSAQFNLGVLYADGNGVAQSYSEAAKWYRKAADQELAAAQSNLGASYNTGQGVAQSYSEAAKWFRKAADQGNADAQYNLGVMYVDGHGVALSDTEAAKWFRKAADQGQVQAQYNLGVNYAKGQGLPENYVEAYRWTSLAAASGDQKAKKNLKIIKGWMTPGQIAEAQKLAAGGKVGAQATGWSAISRSDVKKLQKALNDLGFSVGPADGIPGKRTKSALATFQRIKSLPVGAPDAATLSALGVK